ncbi:MULTISPECIES: hypothetical protein [Nocardioides]|uniref:PEP-CTERM sorting domain-containing protein n=1 Tax=Nocardioides vastitatis TaxID=2568655 RepID=A0ABW0ZKU0_9ACTN|nr:hypothetical protein [Nocardioides sp.]
MKRTETAMAEDWLHFVLVLGMVGLGVLGRRPPAGSPATTVGR